VRREKKKGKRERERWDQNPKLFDTI